jgi:xanthine dehydrogenase YagT iron-sulfur-binding subunit
MEKEPNQPKCQCEDSSTSAEDQQEKGKSGLSRRGFLASLGVGAAVAATGLPVQAKESTEVMPSGELVRISLQINGLSHSMLVEPRWSLLYIIREKLGLSGTKVGCERGECGACTVLINGQPRYACMMLGVESEGMEIRTLEGLMDGEALGPVQQAFVEEDALQCGYCTSGQIMAVEGLLRKNPNPSLEAIRSGVSGNICRCGTYQNIFKAASRAAKLKAGKGGAS